MADHQKTSEDLIREAKESLLASPSQPKQSARSAGRPSATEAAQPALDPDPVPRLPKNVIGAPPARSEARPRPSPPGQPAPTEPPGSRRGLWKFISFLSLGWVGLVAVSIISAIFDQPEDAFELVLGAVVITLIPLLIGIYAVRRLRRSRLQEGGGTA